MLPYSAWRELDPEVTVRFYALRLREARMIKSSPKKIIAHGTDWRFLNELKKEGKPSAGPSGTSVGMRRTRVVTGATVTSSRTA